MTLPAAPYSLTNVIAAPAVLRDAGDAAMRRFAEFFAAHLRNRNTRAAYYRAACQFFDWCEGFGLRLSQIDSFVVSTYIESLLKNRKSAPTVKQHLAAIKSLFDWLVTGHVLPFSPAAAVRGPRYTLRKGKTPIRDSMELRLLFESMKDESISTLRDRALLAVLLYSFARVTAACRMNVGDYYEAGMRRIVLRLHEKGGKFHEVPAHHMVVQYLEEYLEKTGVKNQRDEPLFQTIRGKDLTGERMTRQDVWSMIKRRCRTAGVSANTSCHSFRASGITIFLQNGGRIEDAAAIANHESPRTTKLYDRRGDAIEQSEIERIRLD